MIETLPSKDDVARYLAQQHYLYEPDLTRIFRIGVSAEVEREPNQPIKLLEINPSTIESGVMPLGFDATPESGVPYPTILIEITPAEYEKIEQGLLQLPRSWKVLEEFGRE
jgi:hypothetical protein